MSRGYGAPDKHGICTLAMIFTEVTFLRLENLKRENTSIQYKDLEAAHFEFLGIILLHVF